MPDKRKKKTREDAIELLKQKAANNGLKNQAQQGARTLKLNTTTEKDNVYTTPKSTSTQTTNSTRNGQNNRRPQTVNSSTTPRKSTTGTLTGSQSPSATDRLFKETAKRYTRGNDITARRQRYSEQTDRRNKKTVTTSTVRRNSRGQEVSGRDRTRSAVNTPTKPVLRKDTGKWAKNEAWGALAGLNADIASTVDFLLPDVITPKAVQKGLDYYRNANESQQQKVQALRNGSRSREIIGNIGVNAIQQIPTATMAFLTGGTSLAAQAAPTLLNPSTLTHTGNVVTRALGQVARDTGRNPMFWETFLRTAGNTYDNEVKNGASPVRATLSAYANGLLNAQIEVGGGVELYDPSETFLKAIARSAKEEGLEEVQQYAVENLVNKAIGSNTSKWFSMQRGDNAVVNPVDMLEQGAYGAIGGGLAAGGRVAMAKTMSNIADTRYANAHPDVQTHAQELINRALVQGREGERASNSERLAITMQEQMDRGMQIPIRQVMELENALRTDEAYNAQDYERRNRERYQQAVSEGRADTVQQQNTAEEYHGFRRRADETMQRNYDLARNTMGVNAPETSVEAVRNVITGSTDNYDIDTVLTDNEAKKAVEKITGVKLSPNNIQARSELENIALTRQIQNRDKILQETHESIRTNMSQRGGDLFDNNYDNAVRTLDVPNGAEIYDSFFSRFYTDGTVKGADFENSYNRIMSNVREDFGDDLAGRIGEVFNRQFAQKVFAEGQMAQATYNAKYQGKALSMKASESPAGFTYEDTARAKISDRQAELLTKFAERANVHIRLVDSIANGSANGAYKDGVIMIAADSTNKLVTVAKHELTHHIRATSPELYQKLEDFVLQKWYDADADAMEAKIQEYQRRYNNRPEEAREELIADAAESFFTDAGSIQAVISHDRSLAQAIRDGIKTLLDTFLDLQDSDNLSRRGYGDFLDDIGILREAERMWLEALEDSRERSKGTAKGENIEALEGDNLFSIKEDEARWTEDRIDNLISEYGAPHDDRYSKAYAVLMNPRDFLKLTLSDESLDKWNASARNMPDKLKGKPYRENVKNVHDERLETGVWIHDNENYPIDYEELARQRQTPFLEISSSNGTMVDGHEGRHRMRALMEAGIKSVPVVIRDTDTKYTKDHVKGMSLSPQDFGRGAVNNGERVHVSDLVPIKESNRAELIEKFGGEANVKFSLKEQDQAYMDAVNKGDMKTAQKMVDEKASAIDTIAKDGKGKPIHLYHGTPTFGFTTFKDPTHKVPFIYTSTDRTVSAHYAGDNHYAFPRPIGKPYRKGNSIKDIIENAKTVFGSDFRLMTKDEKKARYKEIMSEASEIADKIDNIAVSFSSWGDDSIANAIDLLMYPFWNARDMDEDYYYNFDEDNGYRDEAVRVHEDAIEGFKNNIGRVKEYYTENYKNLDADHKKLLSYLTGYDVGDTAIYMESLLRVMTEEDRIINEVGNVSVPSQLKEAIDSAKDIGAYDMYGDIGDNPLDFDANGAQFWAVKVPQMGDEYHSTDDISKWAYENGYTSVIMRNIYDYGDKATNYVFFDSSQLKSADPVTYDDHGNVIPLSERFNQENEDIRYSLKDSDGNTLTEAQAEYFKDSKLRDENGNLYVMYHGTENDFNVFDFSQGGKNGTAEGYGIYLSNSTDVTEHYGGRQIKSYVNMTRPASALEFTTLTRPELRRLINASVELDANKMLDEYDGDMESAKKDSWISNYVNTYQMPMSKAVDEVIDNITRFNGNDMDIVQEIMNGMGIRDFDEASEFYDVLTDTTGIDGFVTKWGDESEMADPKTPVIAVAFRSNQIKNVTNENPTDNEDIRYSVKERDEIESLGASVTEGGTVAKYSLKSWAETDVAKLRQKLIDAGFEASVVDKWIKDVNSTASVLMANHLDYIADRSHNALKPNSEYFFTLDLSTLCAKRRLYQGTYNAIMHRMKNAVLLPKDAIHLRALMSKDYEVPCGICYEESRKKNEAKFANQWLNGKKTKNNPWPGYANMKHKDPYIPTLDDVLTTDGRSMLQAQHPEVLESYLDFQKKRGSANPKVSLLHTDYRSEILNMTPSQIKNVKDIGGLRIQSFSDFELPHVLDMMQAVLDMSAMKLTSQAYTKVPAFAEIFGGTGIKINLSLIGEVKNGKLVFDDKEGINSKEAFKLRDKYSKNVGTIIVGANPESVLAAWKDKRIDMVIPFHRSGWSKAEFEALGLGTYTDFQKYQSERYLDGSKNGITLAEAAKKGYIPKEDAEELFATTTNEHLKYWDPTKTGKENAELYLKKCAELHRRPVFYELLQDNGDGTWSLKADGSTDGYWKSLIDFKMYDNEGNFAPQQEVKPIFNMTAAKRLINKYEGDPDTLPVAEKVVDQFIKDYEGGRKYRLADDQKVLDKDLPKIDKNTKYQLKDSDSKDTIASQNTIAKLENQVKDLKAEFKRTNLKTANQKDVRVQAGRLIRRHDSNLGTQKSLMDTFNKIFALYKEKGTDAFDEVYEIAKDEAVNIVNSIGFIHDEGAEEYKAIKDYLKTTPITISEDMKKNITDFNDFRKRYFGKIKLVNGEQSNIYNVYMELAEMFPEQFTEDYVNPADQLYHMVDVLDNFAPYYETLDGASPEMQDYVVEIAGDIMETAYNLQTKKTFADKKYEEKVRAVEKARQKALESRNKALNRQKSRYEDKISALKQKNKDFKAETREKAEKKRRIKQISNIYKRLNERLQKATDTKHLPDGYAPIVSDILARFDFTTEGMEKWAARTGKTSRKMYTMNNLQSQLRAMAEKEGGELEIDADLLPIVEKLTDTLGDNEVRISDLNSEELTNIKQLFSAFEHQINSYNKMFVEGQKQTTAEAAYRAFDEMKKENKWKFGIMGKLMTSNFNPSDFFTLVGGEIEELYNNTRKGFDRYVQNMDDAKDFIQSTVNNKTADKWANHKGTYTTSSGEEITLTDTQLMGLYCLSRREQAQDHIYYGGIISAPVKVKGKLKAEELEEKRVIPTQEDIVAWLGQLSPEQVNVAQKIQKYLSEVPSEWGNETSMRMYGYKKFNEEMYYPIQSSQDYMDSNFDQKGTDPTLKNISPSKATVQGANNAIVIDDIFTVFCKHVAQMASYNAYVPAISDFQRVWNYSEGNNADKVKARFKSAYGKQATDYIENFFKSLNGSYKNNFDADFGLIDKGIGLFKKAAVGGNIRVLVQQPTAIARAALIINPAYLTASIPSSMAQNKKVYQEMMEHCPIAKWKAWGFYSTDVTSAARDLKNIMIGKEALTDKIFMDMYGKADNVTWTVIFNACKMQVEAQNKGLKKGSDEYWEKVNDLASRVFDRTQVVDSPFHRSNLMKTQDTGKKMLTAFMAEPTKTVNMLNTEMTLAMRELRAKHPAKAAGIAARVGMVMTANAALLAVAQALVDAMRHTGGDDDKDKGKYKDRWLAYWKDNFKENMAIIGMIPILKDVKSLWDGYDVARMDMQGVQRVVQSIQYLKKYIENPEESKYTGFEEYSNVALAVAYTLGLPISNVKRDLEAAALTGAEATNNPDVALWFMKNKYQVNSKTKSLWINSYFNALENGNKGLANNIKKYITSNGVITDDDIQKAANKRHRDNPTEEDKARIEKSQQTLEGSNIWKTASDDDKDTYSGYLENIALGIENRNTASITNYATDGLTNEQVVLFKLALRKVDKPNKNGNLGTFDKEEKEAALKLLMQNYKFTEKQKDILLTIKS